MSDVHLLRHGDRQPLFDGFPLSREGRNRVGADRRISIQKRGLFGCLSSLCHLVLGGCLGTRSLQFLLRQQWDFVDESVDLQLSPEIASDLAWWSDAGHLSSVCLVPLQPDILFLSDASDQGLGANLLDQFVSGQWSPEEGHPHQPQGVACDSPGVAPLRSFFEGLHRGGLCGHHHSFGVPVSPRGNVFACPQQGGSNPALLGRVPPDSPCPPVHHEVQEHCGGFPQSPGPDHRVRMDVSSGGGVRSSASLADDDRPLRHSTQLLPASLLFAAQRPHGGGDRCFPPVVGLSPGLCFSLLVSDLPGPVQAPVQPRDSSDSDSSSLASERVVSGPSASVGGSSCRPAFTSRSAQTAPCPSSRPEPLPPRAQYFVVVGGLACCKDDLGCAR